MKILFFVPYPLKESPSQRFRFEQYFPLLDSQGTQYKIQSFLTKDNWRIFNQKGSIAQKGLALASGFARRFNGLFKAMRYDFIFIHREMSPIGPPVFEWFIAKILRKKIIYDFDDAIWLTDKQEESTLFRIIKWRSKVKYICRVSYKISCGNEYLQKYALLFNPNSIINPTTVDTDHEHNPSLADFSVKRKNITIGWTGSHSTLKYLTEIVPCLQKIQQLYPTAEFLVIADKRPTLDLKSFNFIFWNKETEIQDLASIDIGIMPLPDDEWAKGKCGFKAIQYMSLNIPSLVSNVGVNSTIVDHNINGFLCETQDDWFKYLDQLLRNENLRQVMGKQGRQKIICHYSVRSNSSNFLSLFE
ncbi:MAG TPA: glycosyltransferase family 4 protein [Cyclobacteriaceae bacterium]|jgi:glycosyltransferase involved in cell wall biosynthesis|nr:glycosyltransferase family 4 protein [Cyclobacteriaceae bacterium]